MSNILNIFKLPWRLWRAIIIAILTILSVEIGANFISQNLMIGIIAFIVFIILFILLYHMRGAFLNIYALYRHECEPHEALIMLVSTPNIIPEQKNNKWILNHKNTQIELRDSIEKDIEKLEKAKPNLRWNWQQLLRAFIPHKETLKIVYLIGSPEKKGGHITLKGSFESLHIAKNLIKNYFNKNEIKVFTFNKPVDFEDFDQLVKCINQCINEIRRENIKDKNIIIDITGGQKTASIAGAMATLNTRITFQYVDTNPDPETGKYKIWAYDVAVQSPISI